mmetsp:Transcript_82055/g.265937  ORF Transcript_82055/g.265937 Transcript_82055/m.265937 type:complete len:357 (-) Transcript_82055:186-1256(-)
MRYCIHAWSVLLLCCRFHVSFSQAVKEAGGGNPECWKSGFSYELCCKTGEHGKNNNCWNIHFNYDLCCFDPFRPSDQCFQAKDTEELLWHCRIRPNREFNRCLGVTMGAGEGHGWLGWFHDEYEAYAKAQREKTNRELHVRFATERVLESVSMYLKRHFSTSNGMRKCLWGLCHGAKTGEEVRVLRQKLQEGRGPSCNENDAVLGTDISLEAAKASMGDVIQFDFHLVNMDWKGVWDFIYTNTLDHAYDPPRALVGWRWSLRNSNSVLVIHRSTFHNTMHIDGSDVYGGSIGDYCSLLKMARFEIIDIIRLPATKLEIEEDLIFAVRGSAPDRGLVESVPDESFGFQEALKQQQRV